MGERDGDVSVSRVTPGSGLPHGHGSRERNEKLIAGGRFALSLFSLPAVWLDSESAAVHHHAAAMLLAFYTAYTGTIAAVAWVSPRLPRWWPIATHVVDLAVFSFLMTLAESSNSPFFAYFTFALVVAAIRWQWRGTLWTGIVVFAFALGTGYAVDRVLQDPVFELNRMAVRGAYLVVAAALLGYLGAYEKRQKDEQVRAIAERLRAVSPSEAEKRIRVARDLHDGIFQSLTGVGMQLQASRRLIASEPQEAARLLREVQRAISEEQRDLRFLIDQLEPARVREKDFRPVLDRLEEICARVENQWGILVRRDFRTLNGVAEGALGEQIVRIVGEGLFNAARHANASELEARGFADRADVRISIVDNGSGFTFRGTYDLAELTRMKAGPVSLRGRVAELGGELRIDSSNAGSRLDIRLPLPEEVS